ncbi:GYD domain-containing protein [Limibaculum sp. FT325]|uniref:GYD domain-containing protein n=1 Tax=Thermohalobaculum sediminis TaxID=2939436 RepID=UPI0020BEE7F0|nr:GYD domain-containing protein [Limibaculum sediminis]MCL5778016.1 GYD domain-containing protein [Limibaculum sediminis]
MATFIVQGRYSEAAIRGFVSKPEDREKAVSKLIEAAGGKLKAFYVTSGENDGCSV